MDEYPLSERQVYRLIDLALLDDRTEEESEELEWLSTICEEEGVVLLD